MYVLVFITIVVSQSGEDKEACLLNSEDFSCETLEYAIQNTYGNVLIKYRSASKLECWKQIKVPISGSNKTIVIVSDNPEEKKTSLFFEDCSKVLILSQASRNSKVQIIWKNINLKSGRLVLRKKGEWKLAFLNCVLHNFAIQTGKSRTLFSLLSIHILHCIWIGQGRNSIRVGSRYVHKEQFGIYLLDVRVIDLVITNS